MGSKPACGLGLGAFVLCLRSIDCRRTGWRRIPEAVDSDRESRLLAATLAGDRSFSTEDLDDLRMAQDAEGSEPTTVPGASAGG
jgi:hypothetical protein